FVDFGALPPATINTQFTISTPDWWFLGTQVGSRRTFGRWSVGASLLRSGQVLHADRRLTSTRAGSTGDPNADAIYDFIAQNFYPQATASEDSHDFNYLPTVDFDYALSDSVTVGAKYERAARLAGVWFNPHRGTSNPYHDEISESYDAFVRASA